MTYISRITSLKGFKGVLLGRDLGNALKEGHVYGVINRGGYIVLEDLGEHAVSQFQQRGASIGQTATEGTYCLTKPEYLAELEKEYKEFESESCLKTINQLKKEIKNESKTH